MDRPGECVDAGIESNLLGTLPDRPRWSAGRPPMDDAEGSAVSLSRSVIRDDESVGTAETADAFQLHVTTYDMLCQTWTRSSQRVIASLNGRKRGRAGALKRQGHKLSTCR